MRKLSSSNRPDDIQEIIDIITIENGLAGN